MPYIKRTDGFNGAYTAHRGNSLGGLNEIVRDRSISDGQATDIVFWTTSDDIQPGDEVCGGDSATPEENALAYDGFAGPILQQSYESQFIPSKEATVALCTKELSDHDNAGPFGNLPPFLVQMVEQQRDRLVNALADARIQLDTETAELNIIRDDILSGRSVRVERLRDSDRPGCTFESLEDCLVGESVCQERK